MCSNLVYFVCKLLRSKGTEKPKNMKGRGHCFHQEIECPCVWNCSWAYMYLCIVLWLSRIIHACLYFAPWASCYCKSFVYMPLKSTCHFEKESFFCCTNVHVVYLFTDMILCDCLHLNMYLEGEFTELPLLTVSQFVRWLSSNPVLLSRDYTDWHIVKRQPKWIRHVHTCTCMLTHTPCTVLENTPHLSCFPAAT